jgi:hypothetical protein
MVTIKGSEDRTRSIIVRKGSRVTSEEADHYVGSVASTEGEAGGVGDSIENV